VILKNDLVNSAGIFEKFKNSMGQASLSGDEQIDKEIGDVDLAITESHDQIEAEYQVPYLAHATMEPLNCNVDIKDGHCSIYTGCQNLLGFRAEVQKQ
jgi:isoquinoline 1-oxidoreductase beta subunit